MPDPSDFLSGFGIQRGMSMGDYTLSDVKIGHEVVKKNHEYKYPIDIIFTTAREITYDNMSNLLHILYDFTKEDRIINSRWGNPYHCTFGVPEFTSKTDKSVTIHSNGHSVKI